MYAKLKAFRDKYADEIRRRFPQLPRRVSGYNIDALLPENGFHVARALVGSEGTLVTILEATLNLVPNPAARSLLVLGYPDVYTAGDHLMEIWMRQAVAPAGRGDVAVHDLGPLRCIWWPISGARRIAVRRRPSAPPRRSLRG